jgi:uncharacterized protein with GYD domain
MSTFLIEASYTPEAIAAMVKNPQDRAEAVRPMIEKMGGKLIGLWFSYGDRDIVAIAEAPDGVTAVALGMAVSKSGAMRSYRTTPLLSSAEAMQAMRKASDTPYQAPK